MSRRSPHTRLPSSHSNTNSSPLISVSTITYIASWRGQLLICTIVLILGAIYFVFQQPVADYMRRRREEISRERQQELMSLEKEKEVTESPTVEKDKSKDKAKEKKKEKDSKKRKGSLLKVSNLGGSGTESSFNTAPPSSMESSPARGRLSVPTSAKKTPSRSRSPSPSPSPLNTPIGTPARLPPVTPEHRRASKTTPTIRLREPTSDSKAEDVKELDVEETPKSIKSVKTTHDWARTVSQLSQPQSKAKDISLDRKPVLLPHQIPLPDSPESPSAGPSRLRVPSEAGDFSDSTSNASDVPSSSQPPSRIKFEGWSTMPDEGWLPPATPITNSKKKKRKARPSQTEPTSALPPIQQPVVESAVDTPREHKRQDSLQILRPVNASPEEYEAHLDRMDAVIDRLRGELGSSLANERVAQEAADEARQNEKQARQELEMQKHRSRASEKIRGREAELSHHLDQARKHSANLMQRVAELERQIPQNGMPPQSPFMLMGPPSPFPQQQMNGHHGYTGNMSPMVPGSPYGMGFPSPGMGGPSRGNVPHPQMYPSPLLHPNAHAILLNAANGNMNMLNGNGNGLHLQNTSPYRRTSTSESSNDVFAGPLTPGIPSSTPSPYPYELGNGYPSGSTSMSMSSFGGPNTADQNGHGGGSPLESMTREERRTSIEASVLRKKSGHLVSPQEGQEGPEAIQEEKEGEVIGLGMGEVLAPEHEAEAGMEQQNGEVENGENVEQGEHGENGNEKHEDELRSSLSPPQHFGIPNSNSGSGSNFTSNPPTPSPQSRLLTPSHLHNATLAEEVGLSRSSSSAYGIENDKRMVSRDDTPLSASISVSDTSTRPPSPESPLWASNLNPTQLAQRKALAAKREKEAADVAAKKKAKDEKMKAILQATAEVNDANGGDETAPEPKEKLEAEETVGVSEG